MDESFWKSFQVVRRINAVRDSYQYILTAGLKPLGLSMVRVVFVEAPIRRSMNRSVNAFLPQAGEEQRHSHTMADSTGQGIVQTAS